jgi:phosphoglycerol transferase
MCKLTQARPWCKALAGYGGAVLVCSAILVWLLGLHKSKVDLRVPLESHGDALFVLTCVKGVVDHGWYLRNEALGAPGVMGLHDFPMADTLHYVLMKGIALFTHDAGLVTNLFFLLTFPLCTLTSVWVMRRLGVGWGPAVVTGVLFAFLPYHMHRHICHLFLASYYMIPPAVLVAVRVAQGPRLLLHRDGATSKLRFTLVGGEALGCLAICLLISGAGVYYAFFASILLLAAGLYGSIWHRQVYPSLNACLLVALISVGLLANLWPSLSYARGQGPNPEAVSRSPAETEVWALKLSHLVLPMDHHRLASSFWVFDTHVSLYGVALGLVGSVGFLVLAAWLCLRGRGNPGAAQPNLFDVLSVLNGAAVLVATTSGFGFLFSLFVTGLIRCYYRICVYVAFLALLAVALLLDRLLRRLSRGVVGRMVAIGLLGLVLAVGVFDQTSPSYCPKYAALNQEYKMYDDFVAGIEAAVPEGAMVFQLPYCPFPEAGPDNLIAAYEHLRPYLHSTKNIHWSFAAHKGRETDLWQRWVTSRPPEELVRTLSLSGFHGIYLDRTGYADGGVAMEAKLRHLLGGEPLTSGNQRKLFFSMAAYNAQLRQQIPASEWEELKKRALVLLDCNWGKGFSWEEGPTGDTWRWCAAQGELCLLNTAPWPRKVSIEMSFSTGSPKPANLWIESSLVSGRLDVQLMPRTPYRATITVPPGKHVIKFRCDADKVNMPQIPRIMVFRVHNFRLHEEDATPPPVALAHQSR